MDTNQDPMLTIFCTAIEMKEKKKALYEGAMKTCPDQVGIETFRMLKDAEEDHARSLQAAYEELKKGSVPADACRFVPFDGEDKKSLLRRIAREHGRMPRACLDDVAAIETGLSLENASISFLDKQARSAEDKGVRELLERLIGEERQHCIVLADLKFYYTDPEGWFIEKGKAGLDGAGELA